MAVSTVMTSSPLPSRSSFNSNPESRKMHSLKKFLSKKPAVSNPVPISTRSPQRVMSNSTPFHVPTPTRRPNPVTKDAPPAYSPPKSSTVSNTTDSPYAFLTQFDTIFVIDDSGSMAGRSWRETSAALAAITPICTTHDADGIDIYFLNHRNAPRPNGVYDKVTTTAAVEGIFNSIRPLGGTPTGTRLNQILKPYLAALEDSMEREAHGHEPTIKPLNIIVITDGVPSDDVESVIVSAAKKLDLWGAEPWQVGIQFFQVGREPEAAEELQDLDDALSAEHGIRDMVDTVPWSGDDGAVLTSDGILKVVLGAVVKRLDRRRGSDERIRR